MRRANGLRPTEGEAERGRWWWRSRGEPPVEPGAEPRPGARIRAALERMRERGLTEAVAWAVAAEAGLDTRIAGNLLAGAGVPVVRT